MFNARRSTPLALALLALTIALPAATPAERDPIPEDHYLAGEEPAVERAVLGDLTVAGVRPRVPRRVAADLLAAGGWLTVAGPIGDDIRAAAGWLELDGRVGDHALLGGYAVTLGPRADIGGRAWIGAQKLRIEGRVRGPLHVAAREVVIAGRIDGPARIDSERLTITERARIDGDLVYSAPQPASVEPGARVDGSLTFHRIAPGRPAPADPGRADDGLDLAVLLGWTLALLVTGVLLRLLLPAFTRAGQDTIVAEPLLSLGIGGLLLLIGPFAAAVLCVFIVTIPLALAALLALAPLALCGYLLSAGVLGDRALERLVPAQAGGEAARIVALALALLALGLAAAIPFLGPLFPLAATLVGTGAGAVALQRRLRANG